MPSHLLSSSHPLSAKVESRIISLRSLPFYGNAAAAQMSASSFLSSSLLFSFSPLNHKVAVEHITHKWGREEERWDGTGRRYGDIGWGHGRKATTHSLTLYAVKLLGNDFVTLLVPQRALPLPFNEDMNSCGRDSFFERVTDRGGEDACSALAS